MKKRFSDVVISVLGLVVALGLLLGAVFLYFRGADARAWLEGLKDDRPSASGKPRQDERRDPDPPQPRDPDPPQPREPSVTKLVKEMDALDRQHVPYCLGGGHVTPARPTPPPDFYYCWEGNPPSKRYGSRTPGLDCSSAVSMVLQRAGYALDTMATDGLAAWGEPGRGRDFTLWIDPRLGAAGHVYIELDDGRFWGTSAENPKHGPGWHGARSPGSRFRPHHPPGRSGAG